MEFKTPRLFGYRRQIFKILKKRLPQKKHFSVLDLGCGPADIVAKLALSLPDSNFLGIDGDEGYIKLDQEKFGHIKNLKFLLSKISEINAQKYQHSFDAAIFSEIIEHLPNPEEALKKLNQLVKPEGFLIVSTDNALFINYLLKNIFYSYFKTRPQLYMWHNLDRFYWWNHHILSFTLSHLATLLKLYGFEVKYYTFAGQGLLAKQRFIDRIIESITLFLPFFKQKIIILAQKEKCAE
jgi:ubiquinone/menaquinone biosynthesis C-methylase UbiE